MVDNAIDQTYQFRLKILKNMSIILSIAGLLLGAINLFLLNDYVAGVFDILLVLVCIFVCIKIKYKKVKYWYFFLIPYAYILTVILITYAKDVQAGIVYWTFTFPIVIYLLLGKTQGFIGSFIAVCIQTSVIYFKHLTEPDVSIIFVVNFIFTYAVVWVVSHTYETSREVAHDKVINLALKDPLTGANNRLALKDSFHNVIQANSTVALGLIDIDHFKKINDSYGHDSGDYILLKLTEILHENMGAKNVFRVGGEEFVVLFHCDKHEAKILLKSILDDTEKQIFNHRSTPISITFSGGITQIKKDESLSECLKRADIKLYQAKSEGRKLVIA
ncbi:MAG: diguanylate cyclase [Glaciecola sp.]|jgi:diguanylate cyclase